jgi:hypothetical protein
MESPRNGDSYTVGRALGDAGALIAYYLRQSSAKLPAESNGQSCCVRAWPFLLPGWYLRTPAATAQAAHPFG